MLYQLWLVKMCPITKADCLAARFSLVNHVMRLQLEVDEGHAASWQAIRCCRMQGTEEDD